jgi:ferredoxin
LPKPAGVDVHKPTLHIHAERCAHARLTTSRCNACVQACPTQAWSMHEDELAFDDQRCDHCALCVTACPLQALELDAPALLIDTGTPQTLWLTCDKGAPPPARGGGLVPCLHGLPMSWLLEQARQHHIARIACTSGDCTACARQPAATQTLPSRWKDWAQRHPETRLPSLVRLTPAEWQRQTQGLNAPDNARRRFLSGRFHTGARAPVSPSPRPQAGFSFDSGRLAEVMPPAPEAQRTAWQLDLDPQRCTWCMVCARLCPTKALDTHIPTAAQRPLELSLRSAACSACGLCVDACDVGALHLRPLAQAVPTGERTWPLEQATCGRCKVEFLRPVAPPAAAHSTAGQAHTQTTCPTCQRGKPRWEQRVVQASE